MSVKVAISSDFLKSFAGLPRQEQAKVQRFVKKFESDPRSSGINYERIADAFDDNIRSVRIDREYRGIVHSPESGNLFMLLWVDHHDEAYDWARRKKVAVHPETGSLQVFDVQAGTVAAEKSAIEEYTVTPDALFGELSDDQLLKLGVPEEQLQLVRRITSEEELDYVGPKLPEEAYDALVMWQAGYSMPQIFEEFSRTRGEAEVDRQDFDSAIEHDDSKRRFRVVEDEMELAEMLAAPLEQWRVFLHPSQRRLVNTDWSGPVRVLGGAGTGKTVVAIHRVKRLAEEVYTAPTDRILFVTFTTNLAADLQENLSKITSPAAMKRVEVTNLHRWVYAFLKGQSYDKTIIYGRSKEHWERALTLAPEDSRFDEDFFNAEWEHVILDQGIESKRQYMRCLRAGRETRLSRKQRAKVWPVFEEYRLMLDREGLCEPEDAMRAAAAIIDANPHLLPYRAVVVDEGQDFGLQDFRLIRAMIPEEDDENGIFIVGDAHQRIYGRRVVLSHAGIDIRGRGRKLRINYRTTEENRNWALRILEGMEFDDLDGGIDDHKGYTSLMHGEEPEVIEVEEFDSQIDAIVDLLKPCLDGERTLSNTCIVARKRDQVRILEEALADRGFATYRVRRSQPEDRSEPGVRLATMHRVKGLEFNNVIMFGCNPEGISKRSETLYYVAATRARSLLSVICMDGAV